MASVVDKVRSGLPRRFRKFYDQAQTQGQLRYGSQEDALESIFGRTTSNYQRQATAQRDMGMSLLGSLNAAPQQLNQVYSDAGLSPEILAGAAGNPTLAKLAGELARQQAGIVEQRTGAQAGQQYIQQRLADDYRDDVGQINQQATSMAKERGTFVSSLLDELIGEDRSRRSEINAAARQQQFEADQNILDRDASMGNALIGQGLVMDANGNLTPLPGGKADPNRPGGGIKRATRSERTNSASDFSRAVDIASNLTRGEKITPALQKWVTQQILNGADEVKGEAVYDTREKINGKINPNYGKPILNKDGTPKRTDSIPGIPQINNAPIVEAAVEQALTGSISNETRRKLNRLGYKTTDFTGVKTAGQVNRQRKKSRKAAGRAVTRAGGTPDQQDRSRGY